MYTAKDYKLVALVGFFVGWLVLIPYANLAGHAPSLLFGAASVVGLPIVALACLAVLSLLGRRIPVLVQFGKFAAVGTLNTLLNIAILNACIGLTGIANGWGYSGFVALAFLVATTNSYFWNKFWTFQSGQAVTASEYLRFALFTLAGALLNVGAASLVVNVFGAPAHISAKVWANVGALIGVAVSFLWNFLSYKKIVFKGSVQNSETKTKEI